MRVHPDVEQEQRTAKQRAVAYLDTFVVARKRRHSRSMVPPTLRSVFRLMFIGDVESRTRVFVVTGARAVLTSLLPNWGARAVTSDVFISYAHIDDRSTDGNAGWVSRFEARLNQKMAEIQGQEPKIWRDPALSGAETIDAINDRYLRTAATMVCIMSPAFLRSEWCREELLRFAGRLDDVGKGLYKVCKYAVELETQPQQIRQLRGYDFFYFDDQKKPRQVLETTLEYSRLLEDLAYDLVNALKKNPARQENIPCVYVAETTTDVNAQRLDLRRELQDHGFRVVPDRHLYGDSEAIKGAIDAALAESVVSIHLIGARYGTIPEGTDRSVVELQLERARAHAASKPGFCSIAWTPPGQPILEERQEQLLRRLEEHPEQTEFVVGKLEALKELILARAQSKPEAAHAAAGAVDDAPQIYLLHALEDAGTSLVEVQRSLVDGEVIVKLPLLDADETICREEHRDLMVSSEGLILYWDTASEAWLRRQLMEARRAAAYGKTKSFAQQAVVISGAKGNHAKELFREKGYRVLHREAPNFAAQLAAFVLDLQKSSRK